MDIHYHYHYPSPPDPTSAQVLKALQALQSDFSKFKEQVMKNFDALTAAVAAEETVT